MGLQLHVFSVLKSNTPFMITRFKLNFEALFNYSESETSLLNPTVLLQTSTTVNASPNVRIDSNLELVWL